jgi:serine/threonine-protein kinase RsbW
MTGPRAAEATPTTMNQAPHQSQEASPLRMRVACSVDKCLLSMLRRFITTVAEHVGFDDEDLYKIEMAVDEACSNAFIHAYDASGNPAQTEIEVELSIDPRGLTIQIKDFGYGRSDTDFRGAGDLNEYSQPDRKHYRGLGVLIMREFMDDVQFLAIPDSGTLVTLRKNR